MAYSLMGIFNVNMPVLYGEGASKAFLRLQNEIMKTSFDQTIFAWRGEYESSGLLATSLADSSNTPQLRLWDPWNLSPFVMTNVGLSVRLTLIRRSQHETVTCSFLGTPVEETAFAALQCDVKVGDTWKILMLYLEEVENARVFVNGKSCKAYRRVKCAEWLPVEGSELSGWPYEDVLILQDEHYQLLKRSIEDNRERWKTQPDRLKSAVFSAYLNI